MSYNHANTLPLKKWYREEFEEISFRGKDNVILAGSRMLRGSDRCVIFVNGRSDNLQQYAEVYRDLCDKTECDIFAIDHRGQGDSQRLEENSYKGHVDSYDDYASDLNEFYNKFISPNKYKKVFVACHSMGGAITVTWLLNEEVKPDGIVMTAPFFGEKAPVPSWLGHSLSWVASVFGFSKSFVPTVGVPHIGPYSSNRLTKDEDRYEIMCDLNRLSDGTPNLVKPTIGWALASYRVINNIQKKLRKLKDLNVTIFQAGEEQYVDNDCHVRYKPDTWELIRLEGQRHQLWHSEDSSRNKIMEKLINMIEEK